MKEISISNRNRKMHLCIHTDFISLKNGVHYFRVVPFSHKTTTHLFTFALHRSSRQPNPWQQRCGSSFFVVLVQSISQPLFSRSRLSLLFRKMVILILSKRPITFFNSVLLFMTSNGYFAFITSYGS